MLRVPESRTGWLESLTPGSGAAPVARDPEPGFDVVWSALATEQAAWLQEEHGIDLISRVNAVLTLGPQPHPYRRIKADGAGFRLAVKDWRARFHVEGRRVTVDAIGSGYRAAELAASTDAAVIVQRAFVARFPPRGV